MKCNGSILGVMACVTSILLAEHSDAQTPILFEAGQIAIDECLDQVVRDTYIPVIVALVTNRDGVIYASADTFGLGFQITAEQEWATMRSPGSLSWTGIYNTQFWIDPDAGIGTVLLMQYRPFYDEAAIETLQGFEARVYEHLEPTPTSSLRD